MALAALLTMKLIQLIDLLITLLIYAIIARALLSFTQPNNAHPLIRFIYRITDPILRPFENIIPPTSTGIDFSPLIAILVLEVLRRIIPGFLGLFIIRGL